VNAGLHLIVHPQTREGPGIGTALQRGSVDHGEAPISTASASAESCDGASADAAVLPIVVLPRIYANSSMIVSIDLDAESIVMVSA
jgi:hypothetical protein